MTISSHMCRARQGYSVHKRVYCFYSYFYIDNNTRLHTKSLICQHHEVDATVFKTPALVPQVPSNRGPHIARVLNAKQESLYENVRSHRAALEN